MTLQQFDQVQKIVNKIERNKRNLTKIERILLCKYDIEYTIVANFGNTSITLELNSEESIKSLINQEKEIIENKLAELKKRIRKLLINYKNIGNCDIRTNG